MEFQAVPVVMLLLISFQFQSNASPLGQEELTLFADKGSDRRSPSQGAALDRSLRKAVSDPDKHWPNAVIPYVIDTNADFSIQDQLALQVAMSMWSADTCLRFRPATIQDEDYVVFTSGEYCWSFVGREGGRQYVVLNKHWCRDMRTMMHEIGHTIGLYHEQSRVDRDEYVRILWGNIKEDDRYNFRKATGTITHGSPYDYASIMHYRNNEFAQGPGQKTVQALQAASDGQMGRMDDLSFYDARTVSLMYKCYKRCGVYIPSLVCQEGTDGFMGKNCQCYTLETYTSHVIRD